MNGPQIKKHTGNFLVVQWLALRTFTARAWVQSLVEELSSYRPQNATKKIKIRIPFKQLTFFPPPLILLQ